MIRRIGWAANRRSFVSCCGECEGNCFNFQRVMSAYLVVKSRLLGHRDIHCPDEPNNCSARMTKAANIMPASAEKITPFHAIEQGGHRPGKIRRHPCGQNPVIQVRMRRSVFCHYSRQQTIFIQPQQSAGVSPGVALVGFRHLVGSGFQFSADAAGKIGHANGGEQQSVKREYAKFMHQGVEEHPRQKCQESCGARIAGRFGFSQMRQFVGANGGDFIIGTQDEQSLSEQQLTAPGSANACAIGERTNKTSRNGTFILMEVSAAIFCNRSSAGWNKPSFSPSQSKPPRDQNTDKAMTRPPIPNASRLNRSGMQTTAPKKTNQIRNRSTSPMMTCLSNSWNEIRGKTS